MRVTADALEAFGDKIASWKLIPGSGGRFELVANGDLIYSKLETGRHTDPEEVIALIEAKLAE